MLVIRNCELDGGHAGSRQQASAAAFNTVGDAGLGNLYEALGKKSFKEEVAKDEARKARNAKRAAQLAPKSPRKPRPRSYRIHMLRRLRVSRRRIN